MKLFVTTIALISLGAAPIVIAQQQMPGMPLPAGTPTGAQPAAGAPEPGPNLLDEVVRRPPLGLEKFLAWAQEANPTLAEARAEVQQTTQQGRQAALYPNPSVGYSGEHIRGGSYGGGEQGGYVQQEIVLGGKLGLRRDVYTQQANAERIGVDAQRYRVRAGVEQAFYRTLALQQTVVLRQKLLRVAEAAQTNAHQLANVGQADAPDVLQAEVDAEQARVDFVDAQRDFLAQFQVLAALAAQPSLPASPLDGNLEAPPAIDPQAEIDRMIATSPAVEQARQEVVAAEARVKAEARESVPDLTLRAGEWWSGEQLAGVAEPAGPMAFASANLDLPLWNRNQGNVGAAKAELERARQEVERVELDLRRNAEPVAQQYLSAHYEADRYRTVLIPDAQRAENLYATKYAQMASAYPQVLYSQRTLLQLQISYLRALDTEWSAVAALQNYGIPGGLDHPAGSSFGSAPMQSTGAGAMQ